MGTNYYWHTNVCDCCGRSDVYHIGKSSMGWMFALHVIPEEDVNDVNDWVKRFYQPGSVIHNEYDEEISVEEMLRIILERNPLGQRHSVDGQHCLYHGAGTWDAISGEFS